jgi:hypothetical protein
MNLDGLPPGVVVVPCGATIHTATMLAVLGLDLPTGSTRRFITDATTPATKRNLAVGELLANPRLSWAFFVDSDMTPPADTVLRLLQTDLDVVGAMCAGRVRGEAPKASGGFRYAFEFGSDDGCNIALPPEAYRSVISCDWVGAGALLVRRRVLQRMAPGPWFFPDSTGENEDMVFCKRARAAGFPVHVDGRVLVPHLQTIPVDVRTHPL